MMKIIFDGKKEAEKIKDNLKSRIAGLDRRLRLAIVLDNTNQASVTYVAMKKKVAEELGVDVVVHEFSIFNFQFLINDLIPKLANDQSVDGIMVQLPIGGATKEQTEALLASIPVNKDVDGLNPDSDFVPATVRAVEKILDCAYRELNIDIDDNFKIAVVGAKGAVGRVLVERMKRFGITVGEFDLGDDLIGVRDFKVVVSCTGQTGLVKPTMVQEGAICIDVGFPKGDFDPAVADKLSFFTPVPGGVGPMTVVCLFENLVNAYEEQ